MLIKEINNIILTHIPRSKICTEFNNEPYGIYNISLKSKKDIKKVLFCVTATEDVMDYFYANNYDLLWQHHPYILPEIPMAITHIPLDDCIGGNNEIWRDYLGMKNYTHLENSLGWYGNIKKISFLKLLNKIENLSGDIMGPIYYENKIKNVKSCLVVTGLGEIIIDKIMEINVDVVISGELYSLFRLKDNFKGIICIGHTRSEFIGAKLLRKLFKNQLTIDNAPFEIDYFNQHERRYENNIKEF